MASGRNFTEDSARDTSLAVQEAQAWIEAVTKHEFKASFRESLEDGVILCELIQTIRPGCIRKINRRSNPIAHLDNIRQFLGACKELGLKDAQLFEVTDLQPPSTLARKEPSNNALKRSDAVRHIRNVCVTLFWLGNVVSTLKDYTGPQLDLKAFKEILDETVSSTYTGSRTESTSHSNSRTSHTSSRMETFSEDIETNSSQTPEPLVANFGLTFEQEQTADQLLADIQNAVDEMLNTYKPPPTSDPPPRECSPTPELDQLPTVEDGPLETVTISMRSRNGGFGCQIVGGADSVGRCATVEMVVSGSPAEGAGLMVGDCIVSIDGRNVEDLSHMEIVDLIRKGGAAGGVTLCVQRVQREAPHEQNIVPTNFTEVHDIAHSAQQSLDSLEWAETVDLGITSHENKRASIGSSDNGKEDTINPDNIAPSQPSQEPVVDQVQPLQRVQPVTRVESFNRLQKPLSQQPSVPSKTTHVVLTAWTEKPQQVSLLPPTEPTFPQDSVQDFRKPTQEASPPVLIAESQRETRTYKYEVPKVASFQQVSGSQEKLPPQTTSSQLSQVTSTASPPQTSSSLQSISQMSVSSHTVVTQTSQSVQAIPAPQVATVPPPQTYVLSQSSPSQTVAPLQTTQPVTPPQTSSAPQTVAPPSSLSLVEQHGNVKIQKVHHTRWTPKSQLDAQQRETPSEATTPAKTPPQADQRQLVMNSSSSTPSGRMGGSLPRNDRQQTQPYVPQSVVPTQRGIQRSLSDRRQHVVQQIPPSLPQQQQQQQPAKKQPLQTQVALVSHGLYATVTYKQDACSRCHLSLQPPGFVMTVASHKLQFHIACFTCYVCRTPLTYDSRGESTVLIQRGEIHCKFCSSNNQGTKTTEC